MFGIGVPEMLIILGVIALLFAPRLIKLPQAFGRAGKAYKAELPDEDMDRDSTGD